MYELHYEKQDLNRHKDDSWPYVLVRSGLDGSRKQIAWFRGDEEVSAKAVMGFLNRQAKRSTTVKGGSLIP